MNIRSAKIDDVNVIHDLGNNVKEFKVGDEVVVFWPKEILKNLAEKNSDFFLVAEVEDEIVGFLIVNYNFVLKKAVIENIFVSSGFRSQGVGTSLLEELINRLKSVGCEYVCTLIENGSLSSIDFYKKMGFNKGIDAIWMDKVLGKNFKN